MTTTETELEIITILIMASNCNCELAICAPGIGPYYICTNCQRNIEVEWPNQ